MAVPVAPALSARLPQFLDLKLPPTSESTQRPLQKCVGHAYNDYHDETFTNPLKLPTLLSLDLEEAPPNYKDCLNDCPPDYTTSGALATLNVEPPAYAPPPATSTGSSQNYQEPFQPSRPKVDLGYRENLREHKKKKKGAAAAKNKWDSDNEEEKKPEDDGNGDQPGDAGGSGGADGEGGGNDDDDWDDGKKKGKKDKKKSAFSWDALEDEDNKDEEEKKDDVDMEEAEALEAAKVLSMGMKAPGIGLACDFQGNYELFAIVTHKGRSADSGHYIAWVRHEEGERRAYQPRQHREVWSQ